MARVIFDGDHVQALYDKRDGDVLLITFNEMNITANGRSYWCQGPAAKMGISCIGVMTKQKNWFPRSDMTKLSVLLGEITCSHKYTIGYGFSQGGYGAVKYSRLLKTTHSFGFSPQWTINPEELVDPRFNPLYRTHLHDGMEISSADIAGKITIFGDPLNKRDWRHCSMIENLHEDVNIVPVRYAGHASVRAVSSAAYFRRLVETATMSDMDRQRALLALVKQGKKQLVLYQAALGQMVLQSGHLGWAKSLYDMSRIKSANNLHVRKLGDMLSAAGPTAAATPVGRGKSSTLLLAAKPSH